MRSFPAIWNMNTIASTYFEYEYAFMRYPDVLACPLCECVSNVVVQGLAKSNDLPCLMLCLFTHLKSLNVDLYPPLGPVKVRPNEATF